MLTLIGLTAGSAPPQSSYSPEVETGAAFISLMIGFLFFMGLYFVPWFVALARKHRNTTAIFIVNLLLGWTGIGWIVAICMAVWKEKTTDFSINPPN